MNVDRAVLEQLRQLKSECDLAEPYIALAIYAPEELEKEQIGYSTDEKGRSLASDEDGAWQPGWIVIGRTELTGDPIIVDMNEAGQPVSCLMHGMDEWGAGSYIAGSIGQFRDAVAKIRLLMASHRPQVANTPVTCAALDDAVADIAAADDYADADTWQALLEPSYRMARQQEEALIGSIRSMSGQGMKIKDIADALGIPLKLAYSFLKKVKSEADNRWSE
ncbi:hypothetical protein [Paenibacillus ginsengihumi]|jgi:hypothetical protein|uniref:hypothetical protein n=1 Tax=Paenibacillus ginsengihumi TaxID=431596 RepID=UPI00035FD95E|nr:hypothetical protein [Paenibacillus ginsengihumi]